MIGPVYVVLVGDKPHRVRTGSRHAVSAFRDEHAAQLSARATGGDVVEFVPRGAVSMDIMRAVVAGIEAYGRGVRVAHMVEDDAQGTTEVADG